MIILGNAVYKNAVFLLPLVLFLLISFLNISEPSLYMDAVNPDYLATWLLRGDNDMPAWIYPDNILFGAYRFPILNSLYGGNTSAYFWAIIAKFFGFGLMQVHTYHIALGVVLLFSVQMALKAWRVKNLWVLFAGLALATNINFILSWKTQYYLQLFAAIFFVAGLFFVGKAVRNENGGVKRYRNIALLLLGFAAYQYFIFFFYGLPIVFYLARSSPGKFHLRALLKNISWFFLGWSPFVYAHVSMCIQVGAANYAASLISLQNSYGVVDSSSSILGRISHTLGLVQGVLLGTAVPDTVFRHSFGVNIGAWVAIAVCLGLAFTNLERRKGPTPKSRSLGYVLGVGVGCHLLFSMALGNSLETQHFIMLLPIIAIIFWSQVDANLVEQSRLTRKSIYSLSAAIVGLIIPTLISSGMYVSYLGDDTNRTIDYSRNIQLVSRELQNASAGESVLFTQWGFWMSYLVSTGPVKNVYATNSLQAFHDEATIGKYRCAIHCTLVVNSSELATTGGRVLLNEGLSRAGLVLASNHMTEIGPVLLINITTITTN